MESSPRTLRVDIRWSLQVGVNSFGPWIPSLCHMLNGVKSSKPAYQMRILENKARPSMEQVEIAHPKD